MRLMRAQLMGHETKTKKLQRAAEQMIILCGFVTAGDL